jgi:membrane glycosyltransferase
MTELSITTGAAGRHARGMTPAGIQSQRQLLLRRLLYVLLVCVTCAVLAYGIARALGLNRTGASLPESAIFVLSLLGLPWFATGLWNALIGLWLLHGKRDGLHKAAPYLRAAETSTSLRLRVALIMTIRNEDPRRAFARFSAVRDDLVATGEASLIDYFVLSDTSDERIANMEQALCDDWNGRCRGGKLIYRRREVNTDFKAGNVRDFLERWGESYDLMLPLDADSVMSGDAIVRLIRVMQAYPKLGILQSLTVGTPAQSAFARLFQFGMRHSMRSYTMGGAWWSGDCGPYWGHNALIRVRPFRDLCELPVLPGKPPLGGSILSHDQLEAALMRRAGYEVRVVPVEGGSYEDNPPALLEFAKRDVRWCQGNMQYWPFITWPGLKMVSRVQIALAILMYLGSAATTVSIGLALVIAASGGFENRHDRPGSDLHHKLGAKACGACRRRFDKRWHRQIWRLCASRARCRLGNCLLLGSRGHYHAALDRLHGEFAFPTNRQLGRTGAGCLRAKLARRCLLPMAGDPDRGCPIPGNENIGTSNACLGYADYSRPWTFDPFCGANLVTAFR